LASKNDSMSIFTNGKLKPGIYKIQNIVGHTHVDIREDTRELCCRPTTILDSEKKGLWEILPSGPGYTIRRIDPGKPEQFCFLLEALKDGSNRISVTTFPVAWRVEIVHDKRYQGLEHVRFFWGTTNLTWDLHNGSDKDLTPIHYLDNCDLNACRIWKLIPVYLDAGPQPVPEATPPYEGDPGKQRCNCSHQTTETDVDDFGTIVTEVTVTTTTKTMRKKYRAEDE